MQSGRYDKMLETTLLTKAFLNKELEQFQTNHYNLINSDCYYLFKLRLNQNIWLRPYIVRVLLESYGNLCWENLLPILTASETFNISTYQSNIVFDNKIGDESLKYNQFIASMISYDLTLKLLNKSNLTEETKNLLFLKLNESNTKVYCGQYLDLNKLTFNSLEEALHKEWAVFLNEYFKRCELIGGSTVSCCTYWALTTANIDNNEKELIVSIFYDWGKLMQIINDLSDFLMLIDDSKYYRFNDIRNGRLTLPFYLIVTSKEFKYYGLEIEDFFDFNFAKLKAIIPKILYCDSRISIIILEILYQEWRKIENKIAQISNDRLIKRLPFLFENIFLTKYARYFFSNRLIRKMRKKYK